MADFEPITNQEQFDERIKHRLAREREKWEKESGITELQAQLQEAQTTASEAQGRLTSRALQKDADTLLRSKGITNPERRKKIMQLVDLEGVEVDQDHLSADDRELSRRFGQLQTLIPELFPQDLAGGTFLDGPQGQAPGQHNSMTRDQMDRGDRRVTLEEAKAMSLEEYQQNKEAVDRLLTSPQPPPSED